MYKINKNRKQCNSGNNKVVVKRFKSLKGSK